MKKGFISLYREFLEWEWYDDQKTKAVFIHCLLKANYIEKSYRGIKIERGSFITSLDHLSNEIGISKQAVRTSIKKLKKTKEINTQTNTQYTLITVCKYDTYQDAEKKSTHELTHEQHTSNIQTTPTNNINKENKENNIKAKPKKSLEERKEEFKEKIRLYLEKYDKDMITNFYLYWTETNKEETKMKYELEKTFSLPNRLARWNMNNKKGFK